MATANIWNVFLPANLLGDRPVFLSGHIDETASSVYITGTCSRSVESERIPIIGEFIASNSKNQTRTRSRNRGNVNDNQSVWVMVRVSSRSILEGQVYLADKTDPCRCVTVLYDPEDLDSSLVFAEKADDCVDTTVGRLLQVQVIRPTHIAGSHGHRGRNCHRNRPGYCRQFCSLCLKILIFVFSLVERVLSVITFKWLWSRFSILTPSFMNNLAYKLNRYKRVWSLLQSKHRLQLIMLDVCGQQLLDTALGVALMLTVMCCGHSNIMATAIFTWADVTAHHLKTLLHWLMGAPAGLKLNAQLTQYLGHFFLYHVYLWAGYLSVLQPVLGGIMWMAAGSGLLGLTTQLCLVQDILTMLTIHIYCFYVYAARVYSLQVFALRSLWRLFRGKKWNVLRLRVDSALYSMDQLCVGTLLFTALLFLLPTTLLYYCVFTTLRLLVLTVHGGLLTVTEVLINTPVASILLRLLGSKCVAGDVHFSVQDKDNLGPGNSVTLSMQVIHLPLPKLYNQAKTMMKAEAHLEKQQKYSWGELLRRVLSGSLVYPWIDTPASDSKEKGL